MQIAPNLLCLLGINMQGDIGGLTCYKSARQKLIWFAAAPPEKPFSPVQLDRRENFTEAAHQWSELSADVRARWRNAVAQTHLCIGANALWMHCQLKRDEAILDTIFAKTNIRLALCEKTDDVSEPPPEP